MNPHGCQLPWIGWRSWRVGFGMRNGWVGKETPQRFSDFPSQLSGIVQDWEKSSTLSYKSHQVAVFSSSQDMIGVSGCFPDEALGDESFPGTNTQEKNAERASFSLPNLIWKIVVEVTWSNNLVISFKFPFYHTLLPEIIRKSLLCSLQKGNIHSPDNLHLILIRCTRSSYTIPEWLRCS